MLGIQLLHNFGKLAPSSPSGSAVDGTGIKMKKRIDEEDAWCAADRLACQLEHPFVLALTSQKVALYVE
jgi:hypothetical protein